MKFLAVLSIALFLNGCATSNPQALKKVTITPGNAFGYAQQGKKLALHYLCYQYRYGDEMAADPAEALSWCTKAAEAGISHGQTLLAEIYEYGVGTTADIPTAVMWYEKAAQQEHRHALFALFSIYASGEGVPRDSRKAFNYLQRSAALNYPKAVELLKKILENQPTEV